jgi:hypothetical protein
MCLAFYLIIYIVSNDVKKFEQNKPFLNLSSENRIYVRL